MRSNLAILFVVLAVLTPGIQLVPGLPVIRVELFVLPVALLLEHFKLEFHDRIARLLFGFGVIAGIAILMSYTVFSVPFIASDLSILPMLVQYWLIYSYWKGIAQAGVPRALLLSIPIIVTGAALVGIAQKFNLAGVNGWLTPLYLNVESDRGQWELYKFASGSDYARVIGTVGDARHFAYVLGVGISASLAWLFHRKRLDASVILCGAAVALLLAASLLCQSRTGLAAIALQLGIASFIYWRRTQNVAIPLLAVVGVIALSVLGLSQVGNERLNERLFMSAGEALSTSGYARVRDFKEPFVEALENPLILMTGMGPAKAVLPGSEHGEMGWVTLRYGLGGLYIYLAILYYSMSRVVLIYQRTSKRNKAAVAMFLLSAMSVWCLYWFAESILKNPQLMSLNMMVVGLVFGIRLTAPRQNSLGRKRGRSCLRTRKAVSLGQSARPPLTPESLH